MFRLYRPFFLLPLIFRKAVFRIKRPGKNICLSFDDGPDPLSTGRVLSILKKHGIKAVFFCSGSKASEFPDLMDRIRSDGHTVGNHGYQHLDGITTTYLRYVENVKAASHLTSDTLFRPPYGRITFQQYSRLSKKYRIIMWDIMPYDFDLDFGSERSLALLKGKTRRGSVIVLHDKGSSSVCEFLDEYIAHCLSQGYDFILP